MESLYVTSTNSSQYKAQYMSPNQNQFAYVKYFQFLTNKLLYTFKITKDGDYYNILISRWHFRRFDFVCRSGALWRSSRARRGPQIWVDARYTALLSILMCWRQAPSLPSRRPFTLPGAAEMRNTPRQSPCTFWQLWFHRQFVRKDLLKEMPKTAYSRQTLFYTTETEDNVLKIWFHFILCCILKLNSIFKY